MIVYRYVIIGKKYMSNFRKPLLVLFFLLLPWQTRWIFGETLVGGDPSEYGRMSLYAFDFALIAFLAASNHIFSMPKWRYVTKNKVMKVAFLSLAAAVLLSAVSAFWAPETGVALLMSLHLGLGAMLFYVLVADETISVDLVLASVAISMLVPAFFGWVQAAGQSIDASSMLGIAAQDPEVLGTSVIEYGEGRWLRAYGSFPHPNMFGGFLAFGLLAAAGVAARGRMKRQDLLMLLLAALGGGALVMTGSRSAWIAFVAGLAIFHFGHRMNKHKDQQKRASGPILLTATTIVLIALFMSPVLGSRFDGDNRLEEQSISERSMQWDEAGKLATRGAIPFILGSGSGNYTFTLAHMKPLKEVFEYQPVHNVPAMIFVELGLIGFLLLGSLVVATDWNVHKRWKRSNSLIALSLGTVLLVVALADHYLWTQASGLYLMAIFLAINIKLGSESDIEIL